MTVDINKDFLTEYKDDFWKGFSGGEVFALALGAGVGLAVTALVVRYTGMKPSDAVYIGIPAAVPFILLGFYKYQGYLPPFAMLSEIIYSHRTQHLHFETAETDLVGTRVFFMERPSDSGKKKQKRRKAKHGRILD